MTLAPNFFAGGTTGIFALNDLQNLSQQALGGTAFAPGTGKADQVYLESAIQNFSSPAGGDNYTDLYYKADFAGVNLDVHLSPTGKNLYIGGSGGVTIAPNSASGDDYRRLIPGYSWYWVRISAFHRWVQQLTSSRGTRRCVLTVLSTLMENPPRSTTRTPSASWSDRLEYSAFPEGIWVSGSIFPTAS